MGAEVPVMDQATILNDYQPWALTLNKAALKIMTAVTDRSWIMRLMPWIYTDKNEYLYQQVTTDGQTSVTVPMDTLVNKFAHGQGLTDEVNEFQIREGIMDLTYNVLGVNLVKCLCDLGQDRIESVDRPIMRSDMNMLISRLGTFWHAPRCVFLIEESLLRSMDKDEPFRRCTLSNNTELLIYRGMPVIPVWTGRRSVLACVSLDPAHGMFGIVKGKDTNNPFQDTRKDQSDDHGPVLGWQVQVGDNGGAVSWTGAFGIRNLHSIAIMEGLTCAPSIEGTVFYETPAQAMAAGIKSDLGIKS